MGLEAMGVDGSCIPCSYPMMGTGFRFSTEPITPYPKCKKTFDQYTCLTEATTVCNRATFSGSVCVRVRAKGLRKTLEGSERCAYGTPFFNFLLNKRFFLFHFFVFVFFNIIYFFCQIKTPIRVILKKLIVIYLYSKGEPKHNKYNTKNNNTNTPEDPMASEGLTVVLYGKRRRASRNRNNQQVGFPTGGMTLTLFCFM